MSFIYFHGTIKANCYSRFYGARLIADMIFIFASICFNLIVYDRRIVLISIKVFGTHVPRISTFVYTPID